MLIQRFIRQVKETQFFVETCIANVSHPSYVDRDKRRVDRRLREEPVIEAIEDWRPMTPLEILLADRVSSASGKDED